MLLIWRNALLVLNLGLHIRNRVAGLYFKSDGLAKQSHHEDLHTTTQTHHQVKNAFLLYVVVGESTSILQLLASKDETLLIWRNALLVLNLGLHVFHRVTGFYLKGDGLACQGLDVDLHLESVLKKCEYGCKETHVSYRLDCDAMS